MVKSAVGQCTLFPTYTAAFFLYMGALEGLDLTTSAAKLAAAFPAAAATGTAFWPAANLITFRLDPSKRLAFLGVAGVGWNAVLSYLNSGDGGGSSSGGDGSSSSKQQASLPGDAGKVAKQ
jgi:hypothetical protein